MKREKHDDCFLGSPFQMTTQEQRSLHRPFNTDEKTSVCHIGAVYTNSTACSAYGRNRGDPGKSGEVIKYVHTGVGWGGGVGCM